MRNQYKFIDVQRSLKWFRWERERERERKFVFCQLMLYLLQKIITISIGISISLVLVLVFILVLLVLVLLLVASENTSIIIISISWFRKFQNTRMWFLQPRSDSRFQPRDENRNSLWQINVIVLSFSLVAGGGGAVNKEYTHHMIPARRMRRMNGAE